MEKVKKAPKIGQTEITLISAFVYFLTMAAGAMFLGVGTGRWAISTSFPSFEAFLVFPIYLNIFNLKFIQHSSL